MVLVPDLASGRVPDLRHSFSDRRSLRNIVLTVLLWGVALLAAVPLFSVLYMLIVRGGGRLGLALFTELPPAGMEQGGGFGNAIVGTLVMVAIASIISVPFGILGGVFLGVIAPDEPARRRHPLRRQGADRLSVDPCRRLRLRLAGSRDGDLFGVRGWRCARGADAADGDADRRAVGRMVPQRMKDAAYGMGCTQTQVVWKVVLPTAMPGILTGIMLAVAGAAGNSAPLLFTALFSNYWIGSLREPTASLAILIYNFSGMPFPNQIELAWAASLVLVLIVLVFNILSRLISSRRV